MNDDALDAHTRDAQETYGAFGHAYGDCPDIRGLIWWRSAQIYDQLAYDLQLDELQPITREDAEQRALLYYLTFYAETTP